MAGGAEPKKLGDEGLEPIADYPTIPREGLRPCAHLCATAEIPGFVAENGLAAAWERISPEFQRRLASLPPEVLAALHALFSGEPRQPSRGCAGLTRTVSWASVVSPKLPRCAFSRPHPPYSNRSGLS
jgi:hypothetical protein